PLWLGSQQCCSRDTSPSNLFGPFLHLLVEQLVMPAQILSDRGHALIAHQFLQPLWVPSCLQIPQRKAMAEDLRGDSFLTDPCLLTEPSKHHGHSVPGEVLLPLGTEQRVSTSLSAGQPSLCCRIHLLQIRTQVGPRGILE